MEIYGNCEYLILGSTDFAIEIPISKIGIPYIVKLLLQDLRTCKIVYEKAHFIELEKRYAVEIKSMQEIRSLFVMCGLPDCTLKEACKIKCPHLTVATIIEKPFKRNLIKTDLRMQACFNCIIVFNLFNKLMVQHPMNYPKLNLEPIIKRLLLHRFPGTLLKLFEMYHNLLNCKGIIDKLYIFLMIIFSLRDEDLIELCVHELYKFSHLKSVDDVMNCLAYLQFRPHGGVVHKLQIVGFGMDKLISIRSSSNILDDLALVEYCESELKILFKELKLESFNSAALVVNLKSFK